MRSQRIQTAGRRSGNGLGRCRRQNAREHGGIRQAETDEQASRVLHKFSSRYRDFGSHGFMRSFSRIAMPGGPRRKCRRGFRTGTPNFQMPSRISASRGIGIVVEQRFGRHHPAVQAVAALKRLFRDERRLHGMRFPRGLQAFERDDFLANGARPRSIGTIAPRDCPPAQCMRRTAQGRSQSADCSIPDCREGHREEDMRGPRPHCAPGHLLSRRQRS